MGDQPKILGNEIRRFELQTTIRQRESSKSPSKCLDSAAYKNYKVTNKEAKKVIQEAKFKTYNEFFSKLGTKNRENYTYKLLLRHGKRK